MLGKWSNMSRKRVRRSRKFVRRSRKCVMELRILVWRSLNVSLDTGNDPIGPVLKKRTGVPKKRTKEGLDSIFD